MKAPETNPREHIRFMTDPGAAMPAELIIGIDDQAKVFAAAIADLSLTGCAIRADLPNAIKPQVAVVRIFGESDAVMLEAAGRICWDRQSSLTSRTFGMRFRRSISQSLLDDLIREGWVSRREYPRESLSMAIGLRRTAGKPTIADARLIDRSRTGVQLVTDQSLDINERILVTLPSGASGTVGVVWSRAKENRFEAGAVFQNMTSSRAINDAAFGAK